MKFFLLVFTRNVFRTRYTLSAQGFDSCSAVVVALVAVDIAVAVAVASAVASLCGIKNINCSQMKFHLLSTNCATLQVNCSGTDKVSVTW